MEDHNDLWNVKLDVLQFGQKGPDSNESLEIMLEAYGYKGYALLPQWELMYLTKYSGTPII